MNVNLTYNSSYEFFITTKTAEVFYSEMAHASLNEAVDYAQSVFDDETAIRGNLVSAITIVDTNTGEILAECSAEEEYHESPWDYEEDQGFDPYAGCTIQEIF